MENVMATAADKKRWDDLHAAYETAYEAARAYESQLRQRHGSDSHWRSWATKTERSKLESLENRADKIGDKIVDLLVKVSPRGDRWLSGTPAWWLRHKLTWEDAIRPANESLSIVVPGSYGHPDGYVKERFNANGEHVMARGISKDLENFKETLEKNVILVGGEVVDNNSIDIDDDTPVSVAIVVDVTGFGPHVGTISAVQGHVDEALNSAHEILEEWTREHYPPEDADADETLTETFDGIMWELSAEDFVAAIKGTAAEKYIDVVEYEEENDGNVLEEGDDDDPPLIRISFTRITRGDSEDSDDYEEEHGWIDEEGVEFEPDESDMEDGISESESIVSQAVEFLKKEGASSPSSTAFHSGVWYSTEYETTDYGTGEEEERSFHLKGFEPGEEAEIFKQMTARRR